MAWRELLIIAFGDATPEERARLLRIGFRIVVGVHILWVCGLLTPLGFSGAVFADDVNARVQAALEPIRSELGKVAAKQDTMAADQEATRKMVRRVLIGNLAAQLRDLNRMRCEANDATVRTRAERDIEESEQEYIGLTGERYPLPACKDL